MTTLTVLAGERTIGGTQVVVEDDGARLLFDCGLVYDPAGDPFAQVRRRRWRALEDLLALGLVPQVPGLYAPNGAAGPLAVALSHSHLDHSHLAGFVHPTVPVYCTAATGRIVTTLGALGRSIAPAGRPYSSVDSGTPVTVGSMRVQLIPVDHDVAGACGMLIETREGVIAYSGDLRLHGAAPERSLAFAQAVRNSDARVLILEGTRLRPPSAPQDRSLPLSDRPEPAVAREAADVLAAAPGQLGVILLTPEHGARVEALATAMSSIGRTLVLEAESLALATAALGHPPRAPHAVYVPDPLAQSLARGEPLPAVLQGALAAAPREMTAAEIAADPGAYLLRLDWEHFADLLDLLPSGAGGVLLHANGTPLGPFDPGWAQLQWWAARLSLQVVSLDSSGHAAPADLTRIAVASGAPVVLGLHSQYPELLETGGARLLLPQRGHPYRLAELEA